MIISIKKLSAVAVGMLLTSSAFAAGGEGPVPGAMVIWTWVLFVLLALVLYKFAFKPILQGLDEREAKIRKGVEDAEEARQKLEQIEARRESIIEEAEERAKTLIEDGRTAAKEAARVIEDKAKEEAKIMLENARREIRAAQEKASADLRAESATLAIALAGKVIDANLDDARNKALVDQLIKEI